MPATTTNWANCHPPLTTSFEIAGMYPSTTYEMFSQTETKGTTVNGPTLAFTTGPLPGSIPFPTVIVETPAGAGADTVDSLLTFSIGRDTSFANVATDLSGKILWYYYSNDSDHRDLLTRPLPNGDFLSIEDGQVWNPAQQKSQLLQQTDLAGNVVRQTNTGIIQQELLAKGAANAGPCSAIAKPAPVGSACLGSFHHDFIGSLPNGQSVAIADIEKIYPAGTQGDTSGMPVDIIGDMLIVLDKNWQVAWYFDAFEQMDVNRTAVLGETCATNQGGCPPVFLLGTGIATVAHDWLHANSVYYWPLHEDLVWSSRHQDWVMRVNYQNGKGAGNVIWHLGPSGDFIFNNIAGDAWPWFSHQHEVAVESNGYFSMCDNGNTRLSPPTGPHSSTGGLPGLGTACGPSDCDSRGMVLTVDETSMQATPVMSVDLGYFSDALGSAQLLSNGNYFFLAGLVLPNPRTPVSYTYQILPTAGTVTGTSVLELKGPEEYRAWEMPNLYNPPTS
jgi:arylsulfate sulfotransferase